MCFDDRCLLYQVYFINVCILILRIAYEILPTILFILFYVLAIILLSVCKFDTATYSCFYYILQYGHVTIINW